MNEFTVAGVDGCKKNKWLVAIVRVKGESRLVAEKILQPFDNFEKVVEATENCSVICVDIPIGLSDGYKSRMCDIVGKRILGKPRGSSVFEAPIRPCLSYCERSHKIANEVSKRFGGRGLSRQSFNITKLIRQVDDVITHKRQKHIKRSAP